ncbi:hypothetical protein JW835_15750 [bacterium]|nr:hypothetical protein [bacterium]
MKKIILSLFMIHAAFCQESTDLPVGEVIETVVCRSDSLQSYALYLPSTYTPDILWPVIYAFDPGARGKHPVEKLRTAAEKYGYIAVGSNNSRNGPWELAFNSLNAISADTDERFSLNPDRIYTTGFSGGSRAASAIAMISGQVAGIIGCGAGFSEKYPPNPVLDFIYFGLVGKGDMNFLEMRSLGVLLDRYEIPNAIRIFEGGHEWPSDTLFLNALEWVEIQAMKKQQIPLNESLISECYNKHFQEAQELEANLRFGEANDIYTSLVQDFGGIRDVAPAQNEAGRLISMAEVRDRKALEEILTEKERTLRNKYYDALERLDFDCYREKGRLKTRNWWEEERQALQREIERAQTEEERWMIKRVIDNVWRHCVSRAMSFQSEHALLKAAVCLEIWTLMQPDQSYPFYVLAAILAAAGHKDKAMQALEDAYERGFRHVELIENEPDFDSLRDTDEFRQFMKRLKELNQ